MAFDINAYHLQKEVVHDGIRYSGVLGHCNRVLDQVKTWTSVDEDDVIIASYPKSGSIWIASMLHAVLNNGTDPTNGHPAKTPYLEMYKDFTPSSAPTIDVLEACPQPRVTRTHLAYHYLRHAVEEGCKGKFVLLVRNPKDMMVSFYHHQVKDTFWSGFTGTFDDLVELVKTKRIMYGDPIDWLKGWWPARDLPNVHVIEYEKFIQDPEATVRNAAGFLNKELSDEVVQKIVHSTSFEEMASRWKQCESYFRKGKVGDWKTYFNPDQSAWVDKRCQELSEVGCNLQFDLN